MDEVGSTKHFLEALAVLNQHASSLAETFLMLQQAVESRPKIPSPPKPAPKPEKTDEEKEDEYWDSVQASGKVAGLVNTEFSSVSILHEMQEVEKRINDVGKAQQLGLISTKEAASAVASLGKDFAELALVAGGKALGGQAGAQLMKAATQAPKAGASFAVDQLGGIATGLMGLLSATALGGGLFGLMLHGIKTADRLEAEAGELANIFSATGSTVSRGVLSHFAAFQSKAQTFYGITRQETQGVLREFLLAGVSIDAVMASGRKGIGEVGHDAVTLSLAMDKMFELSSGFTAQQAMQLVENQGVGVGDAVDQITRVELLAHRAGIGVSDFTNEAVQASIELRDYGVRVDSVAMSMSVLQDRFKDIGMNSQSAMEYAQQGVKEVSGGLRNANLGMQVMLAQQMGLGDDLSSRYRLMDAVSSGQERDMLDIIKSLHAVAKKQTRGTYGGSAEVREREYLERQGFGFMGAKSILTIGEQVEQGQKLDEVSKEEWGEIQKAFKVEGTKVSELQKQSATITKSLAKMGQSILVLMTSFMSLMIISIKTMLSVDWKLSVVEGMIKTTMGKSVASILRGVGAAAGISDAGVVESDQVLAMFNEQWSATTKAARDVYATTSDAASAVVNIARPMVKPIFEAMGIEAPELAAESVDTDTSGGATSTVGAQTAPGEAEDPTVSGVASLTPAFWQRFEEMCKRLGVDSKELKKVIGAETGWNAWGAERVNYAIGKDGKYKLDANGKKVAQAKGLGAWIRSTALGVAKMTEDQWERLEYMSATEQLPFLERTFRALQVKGLTAEQIHVKLFGAGYGKTNPVLPGGAKGALYIGKKWWDSPAGQAYLAAHPEYKSRARAQYNAYWQNKGMDWDNKGYITEEDVARTTLRCEKCNKVLANCKCSKVQVKSASLEWTTRGPAITLSLNIQNSVFGTPLKIR